MSKGIKGGGGFWGGKRFVQGGRAGRSPGRGFGSSAGTHAGGALGTRPARGWGSKKLGGRPPKWPKWPPSDPPLAP